NRACSIRFYQLWKKSLIVLNMRPLIARERVCLWGEALNQPLSLGGKRPKKGLKSAREPEPLASLRLGTPMVTQLLARPACARYQEELPCLPLCQLPRSCPACPVPATWKSFRPAPCQLPGGVASLSRASYRGVPACPYQLPEELPACPIPATKECRAVHTSYPEELPSLPYQHPEEFPGRVPYQLPGGVPRPVPYQLSGGVVGPVPYQLPGGVAGPVPYHLPGEFPGLSRTSYPESCRACPIPPTGGVPRPVPYQLSRGVSGLSRTSYQEEVPACARTDYPEELPGLSRTSYPEELPGLSHTSYQEEVLGLSRTSYPEELPGLSRTSYQKELLGLSRTSYQKKLLGLPVTSYPKEPQVLDPLEDTTLTQVLQEGEEGSRGSKKGRERGEAKNEEKSFNFHQKRQKMNFFFWFGAKKAIFQQQNL
uniref:Uncharacterized protein n=1 Tax=Chelonoidis abingdonii TaxID=106734 RepID=A0A8C0GFR0_CHEAB